MRRTAVAGKRRSSTSGARVTARFSRVLRQPSRTTPTRACAKCAASTSTVNPSARGTSRRGRGARAVRRSATCSRSDAVVAGTEPYGVASDESLWVLAATPGRAPREAMALAVRALAQSRDRERFERYCAERLAPLRPEHAETAAQVAVAEQARPSSLLGALLAEPRPPRCSVCSRPRSAATRPRRSSISTLRCFSRLNKRSSGSAVRCSASSTAIRQGRSPQPRSPSAITATRESRSGSFVASRTKPFRSARPGRHRATGRTARRGRDSAAARGHRTPGGALRHALARRERRARPPRAWHTELAAAEHARALAAQRASAPALHGADRRRRRKRPRNQRSRSGRDARARALHT